MDNAKDGVKLYIVNSLKTLLRHSLGGLFP